jgi:co-chaperonin GroES (HSP10)
MKAVGRNILVKRNEPEAESPGGVILVEKDKANTGTVLSVGVKATEETGVKENDKVAFSMYGAIEVNLDDQDLVLVKDSDIQLVL